MMGNVGLDTIVGRDPAAGRPFRRRLQVQHQKHVARSSSTCNSRVGQTPEPPVLLLLGVGLIALFVAIVALGVVVAQLVLNSVR